VPIRVARDPGNELISELVGMLFATVPSRCLAMSCLPVDRRGAANLRHNIITSSTRRRISQPEENWTGSGLLRLGVEPERGYQKGFPHSCSVRRNRNSQHLWKTITHDYAMIFVLTLLIHQGRIESSSCDQESTRQLSHDWARKKSLDNGLSHQPGWAKRV
jgi:hypothetical protein